jgi:hypothetical protein
MTLSGLAGLGFEAFNFDLFPIHLAGHGGTFPLPPSTISILSTVWGAWTTGTSTRVIQVGSATSTTLSIAGGDLRGPGGVGSISMVTPMTIFQGGDPYFEVPLYAELTLHFTPEPSMRLTAPACRRRADRRVPAAAAALCVLRGRVIRPIERASRAFFQRRLVLVRLVPAAFT